MTVDKRRGTSAVRDAGLRRVARSTRLLAIGSVAVAGIFSLLVALAHPGSRGPHGRGVTAVRPADPAAQGATPGALPSTPTGTSLPGSRALSPSPPPGSSSRTPVTTSGAS